MTRRTLKVQGWQRAPVEFVVEVHQGKVWVSCFDAPFHAQAILEIGQADSLRDLLERAVQELKDAES
jgi:hypothetical protein